MCTLERNIKLIDAIFCYHYRNTQPNRRYLGSLSITLNGKFSIGNFTFPLMIKYPKIIREIPKQSSSIHAIIYISGDWDEDFQIYFYFSFEFEFGELLITILLPIIMKGITFPSFYLYTIRH